MNNQTTTSSNRAEITDATKAQLNQDDKMFWAQESGWPIVASDADVRPVMYAKPEIASNGRPYALVTVRTKQRPHDMDLKPRRATLLDFYDASATVDLQDEATVKVVTHFAERTDLVDQLEQMEADIEKMREYREKKATGTPEAHALNSKLAQRAYQGIFVATIDGRKMVLQNFTHVGVDIKNKALNRAIGKAMAIGEQAVTLGFEQMIADAEATEAKEMADLD